MKSSGSLELPGIWSGTLAISQNLARAPPTAWAFLCGFEPIKT